MSVEKELTAENFRVASPAKRGLFSWRHTQQAQTKQATFEALIEECWDALWRYAYHSAGNTEEAEDLLSETLLEGFRFFGQFRGETPFVRWMFRIMTTTRIDMVRRAARHKTESLDRKFGAEELDAETSDIPDSTGDPEVVILGPMLSEPVQQALVSLPESYRAVIILADMEQMDYLDVSGILRIPVGTVRSRLHRARAALRKKLAAYVEERW
jgi:RNA polymerase sigma-70 factor (ECF subfamily)